MDQNSSLQNYFWREIGAHGLLLAKPELDKRIIALVETGRRLWREQLEPRLGVRLPGLFGPATPPSVRFDQSRIAAFSYLYAATLQQCIGRPTNEHAGIAAALLSLTVTRGDTIIDASGETKPTIAALRAIYQPDRLSAAFPEDAAMRGEKFDHFESEPTLVPLLCCTDELFVELRLLYDNASNRSHARLVRRELLEALAPNGPVGRFW